MGNKRVVFLVNILRQARCIRRINDFIDRGYDVKVYAFDRQGDSRSAPEFQYTILGENKSQESYVQRFLMMRNKIASVIDKEGLDCYYYIFSLDVAMATLSTFKNLKYFYEVSDLMELELSNPIVSRCLTYINRYILRKSKLNILTSEGFLQFFYPKGVSTDKNIILPNKLNRKCLSLPFPEYRPFDENNIRFSFTGAIRSKSLYKIIQTIGEMAKHEFHLYGFFADDDSEKFKALVDKYTNIYYHGTFVNPNDFPAIYSNVDIVVSYYHTYDNDKYLEPNKLYESIFYEKPIVVAKGTFLGDKVESMNIGFVISADNQYDIENFVNSISCDCYNTKVRIMHGIEKTQSVDDSSPLFDKLNHFYS